MGRSLGLYWMQSESESNPMSGVLNLTYRESRLK